MSDREKWFGEPTLSSHTVWCIYSEQQNQFIKGQILLVSQIVAQGTKVKSWEFVVTKVGILSIIIQKYRTLVFVINLISILQSGHSMNQFCYEYLVCTPFAFITAPIHLAMLSTTFLHPPFSILSYCTATWPLHLCTPAGRPQMQSAPTEVFSQNVQ